jgi:type VII secretion-associated serine protease mycosin
MLIKGHVLVRAVAAIALLHTPAKADSVRDRQWFLTYLDIAKANGVSVGNGITVAIIDTGVDSSHPDLAGSLLPGKVTYSGANRVADAWHDGVGHGTRMAGNVAAHGHGIDSGALGIAPGAKILPIADTADDGSHGSNIADDMARGIDFAVQSGVGVISISQSASAATPSLTAAVRNAEESNVVVVAAAGNRDEGELTVDVPARLPGVVAVGSVDSRGEHYSGSATGPQLAISAPGVDIYQTALAGGYSTGTGTSDATSIVAGAVALVRSKYPNLSATEVIHRLTATATDKGPPGRDNEYGYGVINIVAALTANVPPLSVSTSPGSSADDRPANHTSHTAQRPGRDSSSHSIAIIVAVVALAIIAITGWRLVRSRNS